MKDQIHLEKYSDIAEANNQVIVYHEEFGQSTGEWLLVSKDKEVDFDTSITGGYFYIYKGNYGSCSGCDMLWNMTSDNHYNHDYYLNNPKLIEFAQEHRPYITIRSELMYYLVNGYMGHKELLALLPANMRLGYTDMTLHDLAKKITRNIKDNKRYELLENEFDNKL